MAVQVCYSIQDPETRKRELGALLKLKKHLAVKKMIIITKDEEETILEQGISIDVIPIWKWLC